MLAVVFVIANGLVWSLYYFEGNHNMVFSRSFFLKKRICNLHFMETHEYTDYNHTVKEYRRLIGMIIFDKTRENLDHHYAEALRRTEIRAEISNILKDFYTTGNAKSFETARELYVRTKARVLVMYFPTPAGGTIDDWVNRLTANFRRSG